MLLSLSAKWEAGAGTKVMMCQCFMLDVIYERNVKPFDNLYLNE